MTNDDPDLREIFAGLRREDECAAPPFQRLWRAGARRDAMAPPVRTRWILATAGIAGIAAVVLTLSRGTPRVNVPDESTVSLSTWRPPTDFLLQTPGRDLLATVPRLGMLTAPTVKKEPLP
jgi:hypothetical protein